MSIRTQAGREEARRKSAMTRDDRELAKPAAKLSRLTSSQAEYEDARFRGPLFLGIAALAFDEVIAAGTDDIHQCPLLAIVDFACDRYGLRIVGGEKCPARNTTSLKQRVQPRARAADSKDHFSVARTNNEFGLQVRAP